MDIVHERAVGMDISKHDAKVCVRVPGGQRGRFSSTVTTWGSTTNEILQLRAFLEEQQVTTVVMEATSDYWKPFYYLLESALPVMLVNAKAARNIPGRKTDVSDASWLAQLASHGLLRASFVPPEPIRELRDLTRARAIAVQDRTREIHRLEKFLEGSGIKLSSVVSNLTGVSSRAMLEALVGGERDPEVLAQYAQKSMRSKIPELVEALTGRFGEHQAFMVRVHLDQIDHHTSAITAYTERIEMAIAPFRAAREALITIPGVSVLVADVIIAETGADMNQQAHNSPFIYVLGNGMKRIRRLETYRWPQDTALLVHQNERFRVRIAPFRSSMTGSAGSGGLMSSRGVCLVIEDEPDIQGLLSVILSGCGFEVHVEATGAGGLRTAEALDPVLVTLDVGLPDMSGHDVAQGITKVSGARILMITGWAGTDHELDGLAAGVDAYLIKPFRPAELRELVQQLCPEDLGAGHGLGGEPRSQKGSIRRRP